MMGSKFYAGVPLYASSSAPDPTNLKLAIGALCITDDAPRFEFSPSDCLQLSVPFSPDLFASLTFLESQTLPRCRSDFANRTLGHLEPACLESASPISRISV